MQVIKNALSLLVALLLALLVVLLLPAQYFSSFLPKLLLNPLALPLVAAALYIPATSRAARALAIPQLAFIALYSLQPHKEARFIIYTVPPLTAAAALAASYIWTRRARTLLYRLGSLPRRRAWRQLPRVGGYARCLGAELPGR